MSALGTSDGTLLGGDILLMVAFKDLSTFSGGGYTSEVSSHWTESDSESSSESSD